MAEFPQFYPPAGTLRPGPDLSAYNGDKTAISIAIILWSNPEVSSEFGDFALTTMTTEQKLRLLARLRRRLGIQDFRTRNLGIVRD